MTRSALRRGVVTALIAVALHVLAVVVWVVVVPRVDLVSEGDGTGRLLPGAGAASSAQLLLAVPLFLAVAAADTVLVWKRHPSLRRPSGVPVTAGWTALAGAITSSVLGPLCDALFAPEPGVRNGELVSAAPDLGALFRGALLGGRIGPTWEWFPDPVAWAVLAAAASLATVACLVWCSPWPSLVPSVLVGSLPVLNQRSTSWGRREPRRDDAGGDSEMGAPR